VSNLIIWLTLVIGLATAVLFAVQVKIMAKQTRILDRQTDLAK